MGGCPTRTREKSMGIVMAVKKIVAGFLAKRSVTIQKEEAEPYEREMLLNTDSVEFTAEPISEHELDKIVGEVKKQEEKELKSVESADDYTEFYSASTNPNAIQSEERLTVDDVAAELQEIQVIEKKSDSPQAVVKKEGVAIEMVEKKHDAE